jgi:hypothetical protein
MITPIHQLDRGTQGHIAYQSPGLRPLVPSLAVYVPLPALLDQIHLRDGLHPGLSRISVEEQVQLASAILSALERIMDLAAYISSHIFQDIGLHWHIQVYRSYNVT